MNVNEFAEALSLLLFTKDKDKSSSAIVAANKTTTMQQKCIKRCIVVQFVIVIALVTAIVVAYFVRKSGNEVTTPNDSSNTTIPYSDSENYSDIFNEETDDIFIKTAELPEIKDDDFITSIELPESPTESLQVVNKTKDVTFTPRNDEPNAKPERSNEVIDDSTYIDTSPQPTHQPTVALTDRSTSSLTDRITDFVDELHERTTVHNNSIDCPVSHEYSTACSDSLVGEECFYDYKYSGCSWNSLKCLPNVECKCESPLGPGEGHWSCKEIIVEACFLRRRSGLLPSGEACNPYEPLPAKIVDAALDSATVATFLENDDEKTESSNESPSTTSNTTDAELVLASECPLEPQFGGCRGYQDGLHCDFAHVYKGCTWDVLQCSPAIQCDCSEGHWECDIDFTTPCEVTINGKPPHNVPWGEECDPNTPPVIPEKKKTECPATLAFGSCSEYEENLQCGYNYVYKGCTWDEFACVPSVSCDCKQDTWECSGDFANPCMSSDADGLMPQALPWGKPCDPSDDENLESFLPTIAEASALIPTRIQSGAPTPKPSMIPTSTPTKMQSEAPTSMPTIMRSENPTSTPTMMHSEAPTFTPSKTPTLAPTLKDECPITFQYGECLQEYVDGLQCSYNYAYKGCTWDEISCEPFLECECDHWLGNWNCRSNFENCADELFSAIPVDLPWGETCDPSAELPSQP